MARMAQLKLLGVKERQRERGGPVAIDDGANQAAVDSGLAGTLLSVCDSTALKPEEVEISHCIRRCGLTFACQR